MSRWLTSAFSPAVSRPWSPLTPAQRWPDWQHLYTRLMKPNSGCSGNTGRCGPSSGGGDTFRRYMWLQSPVTEVTLVSVQDAVRRPHWAPRNERLLTAVNKLPRAMMSKGVMARTGTRCRVFIYNTRGNKPRCCRCNVFIYNSESGCKINLRHAAAAAAASHAGRRHKPPRDVTGHLHINAWLCSFAYQNVLLEGGWFFFRGKRKQLIVKIQRTRVTYTYYKYNQI